MKSTVEALEGNKVKVRVEVDETEFEEEVDAAFKRIAREVRLPGFRPGKAPRKILEARLGKGVGREEALRTALPDYYSQAVRDNDVDVIAPPEIDVTAGADEGAVEFDAVVEVRPVITVAGYQGLRVEVPSPVVTDDEIDERIDALRSQHAELETVERSAVDDDHVTIDISGTHEGEEVPGLTATDYDYRVGSGAVVAEIDDNLRGAKAGDILEFSAEHPDPDEDGTLEFRVLVKDVKESVSPELTDEFVAGASEFSTVDELRADTVSRLTNMKKMQSRSALNDKTAEALAELVDDEIPEALIDNEVQSRVQDMAMRLQAQGIELGQYLEAMGQSPDTFTAELRDGALSSVKVDLALRSVAGAESIEASDDDIEDQLAVLSSQLERSVDDLRSQLEEAGQLSAMRADMRKQKAIEWLIDRVEIVDPDGGSLTLADFEIEADDDDSDDIDVDDEPRSDDAVDGAGTLDTEDQPDEEEQR